MSGMIAAPAAASLSAPPPSARTPKDKSKPREDYSVISSSSPAMRAVIEQARRFSDCDIPVLITGEPGTGKRLIARAIHAWSARSSGPFLMAHCGGVSEAAIEVEIFGCEKGAFSGAERRRGVLERANSGTVLLEELGSLPSDLQLGLLRLMDSGEVIRVGGRDPIKTDVRIVSAITAASPDVVAAPRLRQDLYYQLATLRLHMPPLRERVEDIKPLANYFLNDIVARLHRSVQRFSPEALDALVQHNWPGNVRELMTVIQRAVMSCAGSEITPADLLFEAAEPVPSVPAHSSRPPPASAEELNLLLETLKQTRFNITRAAMQLGVSRVTFYRMLQRNGLELRQDAIVTRPAGKGSEQ